MIIYYISYPKGRCNRNWEKYLILCFDVNGLDNIFKWCITCGDMMYLLCKNDVAHFTCNDAMFAKNQAKPTSFPKEASLAQASSFAIRQTSLKKDIRLDVFHVHNRCGIFLVKYQLRWCEIISIKIVKFDAKASSEIK